MDEAASRKPARLRSQTGPVPQAGRHRHRDRLQCLERRVKMVGRGPHRGEGALELAHRRREPADDGLHRRLPAAEFGQRRGARADQLSDLDVAPTKLGGHELEVVNQAGGLRLPDRRHGGQSFRRGEERCQLDERPAECRRRRLYGLAELAAAAGERAERAFPGRGRA